MTTGAIHPEEEAQPHEEVDQSKRESAGEGDAGPSISQALGGEDSRQEADAHVLPWHARLDAVPEDYAPRALGFVDRNNWIRRAAFATAMSQPFDKLILFFIAVNAVMLAIISYDVKCVDNDGVPTDTCVQNRIVDESEIVFFVVFLGEMIIKILAFGFLLEGKQTYLKDSWNVLDFLVVCSSIATLSSSVNISVLRIFRMLRPLKSLSKFPKLRRLISALLESLPSLANVVVLLMFVLLLFSILGLQFFQGLGHTRCRLTQFPIRFDYDACDWSVTQAGDPCYNSYLRDVIENHQQDHATYMCRGRNGEPLDWDSVKHTLLYVDESASSGRAKRDIWDKPLDCFWPVDDEDEYACSMEPENGGYGMHRCFPRYDTTNMTGQGPASIVNRWCGSNYDPFGQPRFIDSNIPYGYSGSRMTMATYIGSQNWGFTTFDHLGAALLTIFQSVTMEGWVDVMYIYMDSYNATTSAIIFFLLILFGAFFMLNLMLAVITKQIEDTPEDAPEGQQGAEDHAAGTEQIAEENDDEDGEIMSYQQLSATRRRMAKSMVHMPAWQKPMYKLVHNSLFHQIIFAAILVNTLVLAMDHHPIDKSFDQNLDAVNLVLTFVFLAEMILKLIALGVKEYAADNYNLFDAFVVLMSMIELALENYLTGAGGFSALRAFRIFRVFKMAKDWESLQTLLSTMVESLMEIGNFFLLLCLFIYIYALVGMQFFANKMRFDPDTGHKLAFSNDPSAPVNDPEYTDIPLSNFDNFLSAVVTIFQILTGENWNAVMYDARRAAGPAMASVYFVSLVIFGVCIVMNIFLAILLSNFEGNEDIVQPDAGPGPISKLKRKFTVALSRLSLLQADSYRVGPIEHQDPQPDDAALDKAQQDTVNAKVEQQRLLDRGEAAKASRNDPEGEDALEKERVRGFASVPAEETAGKPAGEDASPQDGADVEACQDEPPDFADAEASSPAAKVTGNALFFFYPEHPVRRASTAVATHPYFENSIIVLIVVSSLLLAIDSPLNDPKSTLARCLAVLNIIFCIIFTFEAVVKIIHLGFLFNGPNSYARSAWNLLDLCIVVITIADLTADGADLSFLRAVRTIRVLRPLRMVSRQRELKLVVDALLSSIPQIVNVSVVCGLFFLIFAIIGVNCFKGRFDACQGDAWDSLTKAQKKMVAEPPGEWSGFSAQQQVWLLNGAGLEGAAGGMAFSCGEDELERLVRRRGAYPDTLTSMDVCKCWLGSESWGPVMEGWNNFDDVFSAVGLLYEISTTEGWVDIMNHAVAGTAPFFQPQRDHNRPAILYFIVFMLFGAFFVMQLFVGVIIERFNQIREENVKNGNGERLFMTEEQQQWAKTMEFILKSRPLRKSRPQVKLAFDIVNHPWFDPIIMVCIVLNAAVMGTQYFGMPPEVSTAIFAVNFTFAVIFTVEMTLKILGYGFAEYRKDNWNVFDFLIVWGTWAGMIIKFTLETDIGSVASIIRMFRIGRILRLLHSCKTLKHLFNTFITSLPSLTNVGGLLMIILFMYSVLGVQLFALYEVNDDLNEHAHFQTFWMSMITLFRFSTGENWNGMMHTMSIRTPTCVDDPAFNSNWCTFTGKHKAVGCVPLNKCGNPVVLVIFFYTFTLFITLVMLNLFIGIILDAFGETDEESSTLSEENLMKFMETWSNFDPEATWNMPIRLLKPFIQELAEPMGFGIEYVASDQELEEEILRLSLGLRQDALTENDPANMPLHIYDVATALAKRVAQRKQGNMFQDLPEEHPARESMLSKQEVPARPYIKQYFTDCKAVPTRTETVTELAAGALDETENIGPSVEMLEAKA